MTHSDIKRKAVPFLKKRNAEFVGLFGSHAKHQANASSDVDLLVRFDRRKNLFELNRIQRELSEKLNRKVDLVTEGALSRHMRDSVMENLVTLYDCRS